MNRNQVTIAWDPPSDDGGAPVSGYEYEVAAPYQDDPTVNRGFTGDDIRTTTGTSATISGLATDGHYYFQVRAVNPVGKGAWSGSILAVLRPSLNGSVRVSPTTITVDEGDTVSYTIRLSTAPPHPVEVLVQPLRYGGADDLAEAVSAQFFGALLVPSGWTHPHGEDWSDFTHNWSRGVTVTFTAPEVSDGDDDVTVIRHSVFAASYESYRPCEGASDPEKCQQDWDAAWAKSPYQDVTGASVKVTVRDND